MPRTPDAHRNAVPPSGSLEEWIDAQIATLCADPDDDPALLPDSGDTTPARLTGWDASGPPPAACPRCGSRATLTHERVRDLGGTAIAAHCLCGHYSYHKALATVVRRDLTEEKRTALAARQTAARHLPRCALCGDHPARVRGLCPTCDNREAQRHRKHPHYLHWSDLPEEERTEAERTRRLQLRTPSKR